MITSHVAERLELDAEQEAVRSFGSGTLKLIGPAASGKTTALVERVARLAELGTQPESILCFVQDRRQAISLRDRLVRRLGRSVAGPSVHTFHGFAWSLLSRVFGGIDASGATVDVGYELAGFGAEPMLLTAFDQRAFVRSMLAEENGADWPVNHGLLASNAFAGEVRDFLLRVQERLMSPVSVAELARRNGRPDWAELAGFFARYERRLGDETSWPDGRPRLDFAGVLVAARNLIGEHPSVHDDLLNMYRHLLVDDFEEANRAEAALLAPLLPGKGDDRSAVLAGDPEGAVFAFRGADPGCLAEAEVTQTVTLIGRYRRPIEPQIRLYSHVTEEARGVVAEIRHVHRSGVPWGQIAVIMRDYRSLLGPLRREMNRTGVPHSVDGESLNLAADPVVRPILDLFAISCRRVGHEERWPALLVSEIGGLSASELIQVRRAARLKNLQVHEVCAHHDQLELPEAMATRIGALCALIGEACEWAAALRPDDAFWKVWQRTPWFAEVVETGDDRRLDALTTLADALARFTERRGSDARLIDFLDTLESAEFAPESVRLDRAEDAVTITTAHGAKGKEYASVLVCGAVEGMWPDPSRRGTLLDIDLLAGPLDHADRRRSALAEERRLFALATSRAEHLVVTALNAGGSDRTSAKPSRFLSEMFGELPAENASIRDLVLTPIEAETRWRAAAADTEHPPVRRLAALWGLADLPELDPNRWWWGRSWTVNQIPVTGEAKKTSYSRFSNYENCPLEYLYGQVLGLDPETSYHMAYGGLVHSLLEDLEAGRLPLDIEALVAEGERRWRPEQYPAGAVSAYLKRDLRSILERYLKFEAANGHVTLDVERWFEFDLAGWLVRGKIDRIDRVGKDGLRLIDYKTSRSKIGDAENNLQLATYLLACKRDPNLVQLGVPKIAQLLYLRKDFRGHIDEEVQVPRKGENGEEWDEVTETRIAEHLKGIGEERFSPSPDAVCRNCSFHTLCPTKPEGRELDIR